MDRSRAHARRVASLVGAGGALALGLPLSIAALKIGLAQGIVAVASAATWMPARRAALVDAARTLRAE